MKGDDSNWTEYIMPSSSVAETPDPRLVGCSCAARNHDHAAHECGNARSGTFTYGVTVCEPCRFYGNDNPGSDGAISRGCKCPAMDNAHGKGYLGQEGIFVMFTDCPMHGGK